MKNPLIKIFDDLVRHGFELFGRYYSSYRGFVVDNKDPENYGRLKLSVPQVYGTGYMDYWAWPKGQFSGPGYGMQCTPQVKDMVWVEFELGDPKKPIWTYGHFGKPQEIKDKPTTLEDIKNFWFKTPGGQLVEFDDTNKLIRVTNSSNLYIEVTQTNINLFKTGGQVAEPIPLGDTLQKELEDLCDLVSNLSDAVALLTVSTAMGPSSPPINNADFTSISQGISSLKGTLVTIKSQVSTTN